MSKEVVNEDVNEIEDSLRVCEEIKGYLEEEEKLKGPQEKSILDEISKETVEEAVEIAESVTGTVEEIESDETTEEAEEVDSQEDIVETATEEVEEKEEPEEQEQVEEIIEEEIEEEAEEEAEEEKLHEMDYSENEEDTVEEEIIPTTTDFEFEEEKRASLRDKYPIAFRFGSILLCVVIALILSVFITKFVAYPTSVAGLSMKTTLNDGDYLIVEKISYAVNDPSRFDVVVFPYSNDSNYIKRIIGLPGETVLIRDGIVYIDGMALANDYGTHAISDPGLAAEEIVLDSDEYFVLGDNRNSSVDSRDDSIGTVERSQITGKAWLRIYPFSEIGVVE